MTERWYQYGDLNKFLDDKEQFYNELMSTVWYIEAYPYGQSDECVLGTGFCIDNSGYILTCAHTVPYDNGIISASHLGPNGRTYKATVFRRNASWDLAIVKLSYNGPKIFDFVKFADNEVFVGEEVHSIGCPDQLTRSLKSGWVVFPTRGSDGSYATNSGVQHSQPASLDDHLKEHRTFRILASEGTGVAQSAALHPDLPIIQLGNFYSIEGGSGSPVFDNMGCVIGMLCALAGHYNYAVHFDALKRFINNAGNDDGAGQSERNNADDDDGAGQSERNKKGKKPKKLRR